MTIYTDIMAETDRDVRLQMALDVVQMLTEMPVVYTTRLRSMYPELTKGEGAVISVLLSRRGRLCTLGQIEQTLDFMTDRIEQRKNVGSIIRVYVCRIRRKYPEVFDIKTIWGEGYLLSMASGVDLMETLETDPITLSTKDTLDYELLDGARRMREREQAKTSMSVGGEAWTKDEINQLRQFMSAGWEMLDMVDELQRTSRAIRDQCLRLRISCSRFKQVEVDLQPIRDMFETAMDNGHKRPVYRAEGLIINRAPDHGSNPGALYIKNTDKEYGGKVIETTFSPSREGRDDEFTEHGPAAVALALIAENPLEAAVRYGRLTGQCACCGRKLTNKISIDLGIGPICKGKWGL